MTLYVYLAIVLDARGKPHAAPLLALDRRQAVSKAVTQCKSVFGQGSRVSTITNIAQADFSFMKRTQLLGVVNEFDQVAFVALELERVNREAEKLIEQVTAYAEQLLSKLGD